MGEKLPYGSGWAILDTCQRCGHVEGRHHEQSKSQVRFEHETMAVRGIWVAGEVVGNIWSYTRQSFYKVRQNFVPRGITASGYKLKVALEPCSFGGCLRTLAPTPDLLGLVLQ